MGTSVYPATTNTVHVGSTLTGDGSSGSPVAVKSPLVVGTVQAAYQSTDGTAGATAGPFTVITDIQVKNGIVTTLTGT